MATKQVEVNKHDAALGRIHAPLIMGPTFFILGTLVAKNASYPHATSMLGLLGWMSIWWLTEAVPVAVTALLPAAVLPVIGLLPAKEVGQMYCNDSILLVFGSFLLAATLKKWELDKRLAIWAISRIGASPRGLLAVFMLLTTVLGCFMPNTSTASVMIPMVLAVLHPMRPSDLEANEHKVTSPSLDEESHLLPDSTAIQKYSKALILSTAYSCSASGFATLTGTGSNVAFAGIYSSLTGTEMGWMKWLTFALPLACLYEILMFVLFCFLFCRNPGTLQSAINLRGLDQQRHNLQNWGTEHTCVVFTFMLCVLLWATRDISIGSLPAWAEYFDGRVSNGTVAIACSLLLFVLPLSGQTRLLDWKTVQKDVSFSTIILLGGGFAMSAGVRASGLSAIITYYMRPLAALPVYATMLCTTWLITLIADWLVTSHVAVSLMILPIIGDMAKAQHIPLETLMVPATIACSLSFCSPVSTPPNAIAFATGHLTVKDFVKVGILVNCLGVLLTWLFTICFERKVFG